MTHRYPNTGGSHRQTRTLTIHPTRLTPKETLASLAAFFGGRGELKLRQEPPHSQPTSPDQQRTQK